VKKYGVLRKIIAVILVLAMIIGVDSFSVLAEEESVEESFEESVGDVSDIETDETDIVVNKKGDEEDVLGVVSMSQSEYDSKMNAFINDSRWKDGTSWKNETETDHGENSKLGPGKAWSCIAYAYDFVKYMYNLDGVASGQKYNGTSSIKAGDTIRINGRHTFVVLGRNGNNLYTAEGSYSNRVWVSDSIYKIVDNNTISRESTNYTMSYGYHYVDLTSGTSDTTADISLWGINDGDTFSGTVKLRAKRSDSLDNHYAVFYIDDVVITGYLSADSNGFFSVEVNTTNYSNGNHKLSIYYANTYAGDWDTRTIVFSNDNGGNSDVGNHNAVICLESVTSELDRVTVKGWAYDPDSPSESIQVYAYTDNGSVNQEEYDLGLTNIYNADVNNKYGLTGYHAFCGTFSTKKIGTVKISVHAVGIGQGYWDAKEAYIYIESKEEYSNKHSARIFIDKISGGVKEVTVSGWAYDPDIPSEPVEVQAWIENNCYYSGKTNIYLSSINSTYGLTGYHGFNITFPVNDKTGNRNVDMKAVNLDKGYWGSVTQSCYILEDKESSSSSTKGGSSSSSKDLTLDDKVDTSSVEKVKSKSGTTFFVGDSLIVDLTGIDPEKIHVKGRAGRYEVVTDSVSGKRVGVVSALKKGTVKLYTLDGKKKKTVWVLKAESPKLKSTLKLKKGKAKKLKVSGTKLTPDSWSSSKEEVVSVKKDGTVVAKTPGKSYVKAMIGTHTFTCIVTVI